MATPRERSWFLALVWIRTIRVYDRPFHCFLMICQKWAKIQPATFGKFTDKYLVLSYMVGTQIPPPSPLWIKRPEKCYARMLGRRKRRRGGSEKRKSTRVKMWGTFPLSSIPSPLLSSFPTPRVKGFVPLHSEIISCVRRRQGTNPKLFVFAGLSRFGLFVLTR